MTNFNLKIQLIEKTCLFELTWGEGQQLNATLNYPQTIPNFYHQWHGNQIPRFSGLEC